MTQQSMTQLSLHQSLFMGTLLACLGWWLNLRYLNGSYHVAWYGLLYFSLANFALTWCAMVGMSIVAWLTFRRQGWHRTSLTFEILGHVGLLSYIVFDSYFYTLGRKTHLSLEGLNQLLFGSTLPHPVTREWFINMVSVVSMLMALYLLFLLLVERWTPRRYCTWVARFALLCIIVAGLWQYFDDTALIAQLSHRLFV